MEDHHFLPLVSQDSTCEKNAENSIRAVVQREFDSELRGLIVAARLHGFRLEIGGAGTIYGAVDIQRHGAQEQHQCSARC